MSPWPIGIAIGTMALAITHAERILAWWFHHAEAQRIDMDAINAAMAHTEALHQIADDLAKQNAIAERILRP